MNLISVEHIAKSYGELVLFSDISFGINKEQKIALIARNGTGKTSLLNILSGRDVPDSGQVSFRKGLRISHLEQEPGLNPELTVEETIFDSGNEILSVIASYEKALVEQEAGDTYQKAFEAMERFNAWDFETQYKQILFQLQLPDMGAKVGQLSGGQQKRLALANALINKPDLLILDEPTNHLDLEMIEWLETYFAKEKLTLLMVTHDRYFLERVCNEILELEGGQLHSYKGNYSYYLEKKEARLQRESVERHKTDILYKKELDWMRRQPKARTTKSKSRTDDFAEIKRKAMERRNEPGMKLEHNMERLGSKIVEFHKVSMAFGPVRILNKFDYTFLKGDRLGFIGKNGSGKTTFLNLLTGALSPLQGKVVVGETVKFGHYSQEGMPVKAGQKVLEVIREYGDYIPLKKGRQISAQQLLERFLFDRKQQYDFVEKLSGGERKRLYLCTVLIRNPNFLILDEPTNDLDILTLNVLEEFLLDYPGCLVVVSHDRYFMDKLVDHLFVFRGGGLIEDFPGNYSDYRAYENLGVPETPASGGSSGKGGKINEAAVRKVRKLSYAEQEEYKSLEQSIEQLEVEKSILEGRFSEPGLQGGQFDLLAIELQDLNAAIAAKTERWFELILILEGSGQDPKT